MPAAHMLPPSSDEERAADDEKTLEMCGRASPDPVPRRIEWDLELDHRVWRVIAEYLGARSMNAFAACDFHVFYQLGFDLQPWREACRQHVDPVARMIAAQEIMERAAKRARTS